MDVLIFLAMWLVGFIILVIGDTIWLGYILSDMIKKDFKPYIEIKNGKTQMRLGIGLLAWAIISLGVVFFVSLNATSLIQALSLGAFFGFILYACYDLTNYTFFMKYSKRFVIIDIIWGSIICSFIAVGGFLTKNMLTGGIL